MANSCWSKAILTGELSVLDRIESLFKSITDNCFNHSNYSSMFYSDVSDLRDEDWGPESFKFESILEDGVLSVKGTSEWGPPFDFYEILSDEYQINIDLSFEIRSLDIVGRCNWKSGELVSHDTSTYWENRFINDRELFYEEAKYNMGYCASLEEWVHSLNLQKWKNYPELDLDLLQEYWDQENKIVK
jgi:hypothetical protein